MKRKSIFNFQFVICNSQFPNRPSPRHRAFTLVELLVVITIIVMLASVVLGALAKTHEVARADATKATIAKLNDIVMRRYESYMTRRVPIPMVDNAGHPLAPQVAAQVRLYAIRDLMRMEMPERWNDVSNGPLQFTTTVTGVTGAVNVTRAVPQPVLQATYQLFYNSGKGYTGTIGPDHAGAKCLYLWVMNSIPEARSMFTAAEVGAPDGDQWNMFLDGWGNPICWLRWAPGASGTATTPSYSDIQIPDPTPGPPTINPSTGKSLGGHHDPFDYRNVDTAGYQLFPLIYAGVISKDTSTFKTDDYGISPQQNILPTVIPCTNNAQVGALLGNVTTPRFTNHRMN